MRTIILLSLTLLMAADAQAGTRARDPWNVAFDAATTSPAPASLFEASMTPVFDSSLSSATSTTDQTAAPARAFEYSDAYRTRAKIHKIASFATLPLFATEFYLGQSLYNNGGQSKKSAHVAVGTAIITLFGVNTVMGVWNFWEARKDPNGHTTRLVHGILMLAANAGFVATAMLAPHSEEERDYYQNNSNSRATHRAVAFTSIGIGTVGYLVMLLGR